MGTPLTIYTVRSAVIRTLYALAQRPEGVNTLEGAKATGSSQADCCTRLNWMRRTGRAQQKPHKEGRMRSRFFADPAVTLEAIEAGMLAKYRTRMAENLSRRKVTTAISKRSLSIKPERIGTALYDVRATPEGLKRRTGRDPSMLPGSGGRGPRSKGPQTPEVIITPVRTVCKAPTHDARYQLPPGERVVGGFATLGPGRYDDQVGVGFAAYLTRAA